MNKAKKFTVSLVKFPFEGEAKMMFKSRLLTMRFWSAERWIADLIFVTCLMMSSSFTCVLFPAFRPIFTISKF